MLYKIQILSPNVELKVLKIKEIKTNWNARNGLLHIKLTSSFSWSAAIYVALHCTVQVYLMDNSSCLILTSLCSVSALISKSMRYWLRPNGLFSRPDCPALPPVEWRVGLIIMLFLIHTPSFPPHREAT